MDHFLEEVVVKRKRGLNNLLYMLANVVMVISAILGVSLLQMLFMAFDVVSLVMTIVFIGVAALLLLCAISVIKGPLMYHLRIPRESPRVEQVSDYLQDEVRPLLAERAAELADDADCAALNV